MKKQNKLIRITGTALALMMAFIFTACEDEIVATSILTTEVDPQQITGNSAVVTAEILEKSGVTHGEYGFCWNTGGNPTIADAHSIIGTNPDIGEFSAEITPLNPQTNYAVSAFVRVGDTYAYAPMMIFQTSSGISSNFFLDERFSSNTNGWMETVDTYTTFEITGGQYHLLYNEPGFFTRSWNYLNGLAEVMNMDEIVIQFDLESENASQSGNTSDFGFIWNVTDMTFSFVLISIDDAGNSLVYTGNYDNGFDVTGSFSANSYLSVQSESYEANIQMVSYQNQSIDLLINGYQAYSFDEPFINDYIGFYVSESDNYVDNLQIFSNEKKNVEPFQPDGKAKAGLQRSEKVSLEMLKNE